MVEPRMSGIAAHLSDTSVFGPWINLRAGKWPYSYKGDLEELDG